MKILWGAGIALKNNWILIKKYFNPDAIIDSNPDKYDEIKSYIRLPFFPPEYLADCPKDKEVLITVGDPCSIEDITERLRDMNVKSFMALTDVIDKWGEKEILPSCLDFSKTEKKIVLFNTPEHDNIGDHLIASSTINLLKEIFFQYTICEISDIEYLWYKKKIHDRITQNDIILISGGGYLGSLWLYNGELNVRSLIREYSDNRIIILPQTLFFEENNRGKRIYKESCDIYRKHNNLELCVRDYSSKLIAEKMMNRHGSINYLPDMAMFYNVNKFQIKTKKDLILVCLRSDKESLLDQYEKKKIYEELSELHCDIKGTSMHSSDVFGKEKREIIIRDKIREISEARLIITDTLHCMITAALAGTTCIAFDNVSRKVSGVYEWIKDLDYIRVCKTVDELKESLRNLPRKNKYHLRNREEYVEKIKKIITGE